MKHPEIAYRLVKPNIGVDTVPFRCIHEAPAITKARADEFHARRKAYGSVHRREEENYGCQDVRTICLLRARFDDYGDAAIFATTDEDDVTCAACKKIIVRARVAAKKDRGLQP